MSISELEPVAWKLPGRNAIIRYIEGRYFITDIFGHKVLNPKEGTWLECGSLPRGTYSFQTIEQAIKSWEKHNK